MHEREAVSLLQELKGLCCSVSSMQLHRLAGFPSLYTASQRNLAQWPPGDLRQASAHNCENHVGDASHADGCFTALQQHVHGTCARASVVQAKHARTSGALDRSDRVCLHARTPNAQLHERTLVHTRTD